MIIPHRQSCCRHQGSQHEAAGPDLHKIRSTMAGFEPKTTGDAVVMQEMLRGLNELFTAYHARREAAAGHVQSSIWWAICFIGLLAVGFTTFLRMRSPGMRFFLVAGFTTTIVIVASLIAQLNYPFCGEISVSSAPFEHALGTNLPAAPIPTLATGAASIEPSSDIRTRRMETRLPQYWIFPERSNAVLPILRLFPTSLLASVSSDELHRSFRTTHRCSSPAPR